jgi:Ca2+-binding EF-hand superfamily protein
MKIVLLAAAAGGAVLMIALAAQDRGFEFRGPASRVATALDSDRDGTLSAAELLAAPTALRQLDANGDGQLTPDELRSSFAGRRGGEGFGRGEGGERGGGAEASADDLADILMAFDRNSDGNLVRSEVPERFQGLFDRADTNKDAALSREELKQSATTTAQQGGGRGRGGRGGPMQDPLLRALDVDRDGSLSRSEIAAAPDGLKSLDRNGDGQLSPEEFRSGPGRGSEVVR